MIARIQAGFAGAQPASAPLALRLWRSSLGRKYLAALTGLLLFGFVVAHMLGNLKVFLGAESLNAYAKFLKSAPELLWPARLGLLGAAMLHVTAVISLWRENRAARPVAYAGRRAPVAASLASRSMTLSGSLVLAFIVFHLLHFTMGVVDPDLLALRDTQGRHDVYGMVVREFSRPAIAVFYLVATGLLCLHLRHGVSSLFQSLGLRNKRYDRAFDRLAVAAAAAIFAGNGAIVLAALCGLLPAR
ncbi:MAG: succinate dehydrogenase cytochrome b subunit [Blastocatellia bacterium]